MIKKHCYLITACCVVLNGALIANESTTEDAELKESKSKLQNQTEKLVQEKKWGEAIQTLEAFLEKHPDDLEIRVALGRVYTYSNNLQKSLDNLLVAHKIEPENEDINILLGFNYLYLNNLGESRKMFQMALDHNEKSVEALAGLGRIAILEGNEAEGEQYLTKALGYGPNRVTPLEFLAQLRDKQSRHEEAKLLYEKLIESDPNNEFYKSKLDNQNLLISEHQEEVANKDIYYYLNDFLNTKNEIHKKIEKQISEEKWTEAAENLENYLKMFPDDLENRINLGRMYSYSNQIQKAIDNFLLVYNKDPEHKDIKNLLGFNYIYIDQLEKSREMFENVLVKDFTNNEALSGLGRIATLEKDYDRAEEYFKKVLELHPKDSLTLEYIALMRMEQKRYQEAEEIYKNLNADFPENKFYKKGLEEVVIAPIRDLGSQFEKDKNFKEAEGAYRELLLKAPEVSDHYLMLARVLVAEKMSDEALELYHKGMELKLKNKEKTDELKKAIAFTYLWKGMEEEGTRNSLKLSDAWPYIQTRVKESYILSEEWFDSVLEDNPKDAEALAGLATLLANTDRRSEAKAKLIEALEIDPNNTNVLAYWGAYHTRERKNFSATEIYAESVELSPNDNEAYKSYKDSYRLINPIYTLTAFYDEENEKSQILDVWDARLKDYYYQFNAFVPVKDSLAMVGQVRDEYIVLSDLIRGPKLYSFNIQRAKIGFESTWGPYVALSGGCGASYFQPYKKTFTVENTGLFWEPYLRFLYNKNHHTVLLETFAESPFVARDFVTNTSSLLCVQTAHAFYEYDLGRRSSIGIEGAYGWWRSSIINNQQQVGSAWLQLTPPRLWENISFRYQFVYGRFNDLTPDFYVYRPQLTHWLKFDLIKSWCDDFIIAQAGYWHGWQRSFEQGQIIVVNPLAAFMWRNRQIDVVYARIKSKVGDSLEISLGGTYSHETYSYTIATATCEVAWRF